MNDSEQKLTNSFTVDGFVFTLIKRQNDIALFKKRKPGHSQDHFEVVRIQHHNAVSIRGRPYPNREAMPPNESWGTDGFSYLSLERAECGYDTLLQSNRVTQT